MKNNAAYRAPGDHLYLRRGEQVVHLGPKEQRETGYGRLINVLTYRWVSMQPMSLQEIEWLEFEQEFSAASGDQDKIVYNEADDEETREDFFLRLISE